MPNYADSTTKIGLSYVCMHFSIAELHWYIPQEVI